MTVVLAGACLFVYVRLRTDLNESVEASLRARAAAVAALTQRPGATLRAAGAADPEEAEEAFAQLLSSDGRALDAAGGARHPALRPAEAARVSRGAALLIDREIAGIEGTARVLARPLMKRRVVVVGQSLDDRDEALTGLVTSFAVGGPIAVLAASVIGYLLAAAGLRPVEAMRQRAERVSLARSDERLPLPAAHDEVRRLGETLNDMLARLEASFERERRFVADAGHELRTPLAVLKTELEAALHQGGHSPEVRASLAAAADEADQLAQLAEDLLLLARAADAQLPVRPERVDVGELLERTRQRFADRARVESRAIEVDVPEGLEAELDPLRARQALGNLVDNALRHGAGDICLAARAHDGGVAIEVRDHGPGFPSELASRAFERFARGDPARRRGGAGLGLAIVSGIAEAHGGTAAIVEPGAGRTTVRLSFPSARMGRPAPA